MYSNSLYPVNTGTYNLNKTRVQRKEDEEQQSSNAKAQMQENQRPAQPRPSGNTTFTGISRQQYPNGQLSAIDYSKSTVNIAQIVTDFKNTTAAIGAPDDIRADVETYLGLIEKESLKTNPNGKIIQTNLKTASKVLDNYIAETLKKPSDVVEKWIDALFLQNIDFKSDPKAINPDFQVQLPERNTVETAPPAPEQTEQEAAKQTEPAYPNLPQNQEVKKAFIKGKKYFSINDTDKALSAFEDALKLADEQGDTESKPLIFLEIAKIYDGHDLMPQALTLYNKAASDTENPKIKASAYYAMGKIYDNSVQFHPAMEHYFASAAYAGEADNLKSQTLTLMNMGNMFADRYNAEEAKNYYETAQLIAEETADNKLSGKVYKLSAGKMSGLNEPKLALDYYKQSSYHFDKINEDLELASNYTKSSALMLKLGNTNKAKTLLQKAQNIYRNNNMPENIFAVEKELRAIES